MKTICVLNDKVVMSQDGDALIAMQANAEQYQGAVASVVSNAEYEALMELETAAELVHIPKLKQRLATKRYEKETGGIVWNGRQVHTLRESQDKLENTRRAFERGHITEIDWKFADEVNGTPFRILSPTEFTSLHLAALTYIVACYKVESVKYDEIKNTGTTNLETGWPT